MYAIKPIMTAGLFAALGLAPAAFAQSTGTPTAAAPSAQSAAPSAPSTATQTSSSATAAPQQTNPNQEAARQALAAARQSLAELTKMPEAQKLQGEQRTAVANFISDFNAFATAQNDWRGKYEVVDESLNKLLGEAESATPPSSTASSSTPATAAGSAGAAGDTAASGSLDPAIVAKLQEVRTHLKEFEQSSGDPLFAVDAIQKQLDAASTTGGANGVTLSPAQVEDIRKQLETIRQAAKK